MVCFGEVCRSVLTVLLHLMSPIMSLFFLNVWGLTVWLLLRSNVTYMILYFLNVT